MSHSNNPVKELMQDKLRPRRLEPDTLEYLRNVSQMLAEAEEKEFVLWNVLEEVAKRGASAASDRHASEIIETLLDMFNAHQLRYLTQNLAGYYAHLFTNRYSSHVLQKLFVRVGPIVQDEVQGVVDVKGDDEESAERKASFMSDIIVEMCEEIQGDWGVLLQDISATHAMRALICVLSGRKITPEKRGKKAKHRAIQFEYQDNDDKDVMTTPASFEGYMNGIFTVIVGKSARELRESVCDTQAGPLISLTLRVVEPEKQIRLIKKLLGWDDEQQSVKVFYELSGDSVGSHFIEALFESCPPDFWEAVYNRCLDGQLLEYAKHHVANYVVQHVIKSVRKPSMLGKVIYEIKDGMVDLLQSNRRGVLWKLAEACVKHNTGQKTVFEGLKESVKEIDTESPAQTFVGGLLSLRLPSENSNSRLWLDVSGANIVTQLMKFGIEYQKEILESILEMPVVELLEMAKDSTGSRCIIEPIWDIKEDETTFAKEKLFEKFTGKFGDLAYDRMGTFTVLKAFKELGLPSKTIIAEELSSAETKLNGVHFGRLALKECRIADFKDKRERWVASFSKTTKVAALYQDILQSQPEVKDKKDDSTSSKKKKKRKREKKEEEGDIDLGFVQDALQQSVGSKKKPKKSKSKN